jgi:hypothetical protein
MHPVWRERIALHTKQRDQDLLDIFERRNKTVEDPDVPAPPPKRNARDDGTVHGL